MLLASCPSPPSLTLGQPPAKPLPLFLGLQGPLGVEAAVVAGSRALAEN